jgi:hypothetical protein
MDVERSLLELDVDWPATPDLTTAVMTRIAAEPREAVAGEDRRDEIAGGGGRVSRAPWRRLPTLGAGWRARVAYVAVALVVLAGGTLAVSPDARSTVLRWLGLESVEIRREPLRPGVGRNLDLGEPTTIPPGTPIPSALGRPDAAYATPLPDGRTVTSLVYGGPPMVLVQTFRATATPFIQKTVGSADSVERLTLDGATAYWIKGSHGFAFEGPNGVAFEDERVSDRVLLVERGGRLYRVEGEISRDRAVEIYRSIQ